MKEYKNVIVLDMASAMKPDIEQLNSYDAIFVPRAFKNEAPMNILALYVPFKKVYTYGEF